MSSTPSLEDILSQRLESQRAIVNVDEPQLKLVIFALGRDGYAFQGEHVREILADVPVHFVPGCPPSLEGVINVRGDIASVIRLHEMLQLPLPATPVAAGSNTILLGSGEGVDSGIRVDGVLDVVDLPASLLQAPPANLAQHLRPLVVGVLHWQERPITVLSLPRLLADYAQGLG